MNNNLSGTTKPWLSVQKQIDLLKSRGMTVSDEPLAAQYLSRIGYYRLSGYSYPFRQHNSAFQNNTDSNQRLDIFEIGTHFCQVVDLYVFDKKLRLLLMDALERIEIAMRFEIAYILGQKNTLAYQRPNLFDKRFSEKNKQQKQSKNQSFMENHNKCIERSKEEFIKHHKNRKLPIWVACEVWDFGMLSHLFSGMKPDDQTVIANKFDLSQGKTLASWLQSLSVLRNLCAHHSRVWNKGLAIKPILPKDSSLTWINTLRGDDRRTGRVFLLLCICTHMLRVICPKSTWAARLITHLKTFPEIAHPEINLCAMGSCDDWEQIILNVSQ